MRHQRPSLARTIVLSSVAVALLSSACNRSDRAPAGGKVASAKLTGDATCGGTTVHEKHVAQFACGTCHPSGAVEAFTNPYTFPSGRTSTLGGTIVLATATTPTTCTVACHYPMGAAAHAVAWTVPGPLACTACHDLSRLPATHPAVTATMTRADCQGCHLVDAHMEGTVKLVGHPAAWMDQTSAGFHAFSANQGLSACQGCHRPDLSGGVTGFSCGQCHDAGLPAGTTWARNCTMCHGGTDNLTGAPPKATWGNGGDAVRTGAHSRHVVAGALMAAADCNVCHQKPTDAFSNGHIAPGPAPVTFAGLAVGGAAPSWTRATATCASTYCHGATLAGGTNTNPVWTSVGTGQAACGTCHGLPPPSPHPTVTEGLTACVGCHPATMAADGSVIPPSAGGKHLDGAVEAIGGHGPDWMNTTSPGFHAYSADQGFASCQTCHGPNLDGVGGSSTVSCAQCHGATWRTNCIMCHGGTNDTTGAPPKTTWGNSGDPLRVGAHAKHVTGVGNTIGGPFDCTVCHVKPTDALDAGHVTAGPAIVTFGGLAAGGGAVNPSWNRSTGTCASNYCHGGYSGTFTYFFYDTYYTFAYTGGNGTPSWVDGPMTCTSCHGSPPNTGGDWHSGSHGGGDNCDLCHPGVNATGTGFTDRSKHLNGVIDVTPAFTSSCFRCH